MTTPNDPESTDRPKTIGVKIGPDLYHQLAVIKRTKGFKSMKETLLFVARLGAIQWASGNLPAMPAPEVPEPEPGSKNLLT